MSVRKVFDRVFLFECFYSITRIHCAHSFDQFQEEEEGADAVDRGASESVKVKVVVTLVMRSAIDHDVTSANQDVCLRIIFTTVYVYCVTTSANKGTFARTTFLPTYLFTYLCSAITALTKILLVRFTTQSYRYTNKSIVKFWQI